MTDQLSDTENREENSFLSRARYAKGKKTLQAIHAAAYDVITSEGLTAASQEAIAKRANVTQSALRHYFPTKDDLLLAVFSTGIERMQGQFKAKLAEKDADPRQQLIDLATIHFDRMGEVKDIYFFETSAFLSRNPQTDIRSSWHQVVRQAYLDLIREIHPEWEEERCLDAAFQVFTLVLGGWITMGESLTFRQHQSSSALRAILVRGIERLVE